MNETATGVAPGSPKRTKVGKSETAGYDMMEPAETSAALLAQVAAIRESAERHRGNDMSESESEEEDGMESSELFKKTLKMYYHDLGTAHGEGSKSKCQPPFHAY